MTQKQQTQLATALAAMATHALEDIQPLYLLTMQRGARTGDPSQRKLPPPRHLAVSSTLWKTSAPLRAAQDCEAPARRAAPAPAPAAGAAAAPAAVTAAATRPAPTTRADVGAAPVAARRAAAAVRAAVAVTAAATTARLVALTPAGHVFDNTGIETNKHHTLVSLR